MGRVALVRLDSENSPRTCFHAETGCMFRKLNIQKENVKEGRVNLKRVLPLPRF